MLHVRFCFCNTVGANAVGELAHLGGAFGFVYVHSSNEEIRINSATSWVFWL